MRLRAKRGLLALCIGLPVVEVVTLGLLERSDAVAIGPHATALAPFALLHDLRWLVVYHPSLLAFVLEWLLLLAVRGSLFALTVRLAWPATAVPPRTGRALRNGVAYAAMATLVLAPWTALLFGLAVVPLSWLFFAAVPVVLLIALLVHRGVVVGNWWRLPSLRSAAWVLASFVVLTSAGAVIVLTPLPVAVLATGAAGLFNAWAWHSLVFDLVGGEGAPRGRRLVPVAVPIVFGLIVGVAAIVFRPGPATAPHPRVEDDGVEPVLVARGFGGGWDGDSEDVLAPPYREVRFSYRGLGAGDEPLAYDASHTKRPLGELVAEMRRQVAALAERHGGPVRIVAISEGALVAQLYLVTTPDPPVSRVVFLSPLLRPAQVYYPPPGTDGWGVAGGHGLDAMLWLISGISPFELAAQSPLARSILDHGPAIRAIPTCEVQGVSATILLPLASAVATPPDVDSQLPIHIVGAQHAGILDPDGSNPVVEALLAGRRPPGAGSWSAVNRFGRAAAASWQMPRLPVDYPAPWLDGEQVVGPGGLLPCDVAAQRIRTWIGSPEA